MAEAPGHKDRLSVLDNSFLAQENQSSHMHVGAMMVFDGPPVDHLELVEHVEARLHLVPRYRQRLAVPRLEMGRPLWVDDPSFNIHYHVRHTALPAPGTIEQLRALLGRIYSQRLDRSKPLWEIWLVEGLAGGGFALISKTHHALIDGMAGVDIIGLLFDVTPTPRDVPPPDQAWQPHPVPGTAELLATGLRDAARAPFGLAGRALSALRAPGATLARAREAAEGLGEVAWASINAAPETPLNVAIGPHRRLREVEFDLAELKAIKSELGGTVNDVVLAVVTGALRRWLRTRGVRTEGLELRALVPVSVRTESDQYQFGNRIAAMRGPLPVYAEDPVERLRIVRESMQGLKESKQALGAEVIAGIQNFAPPTLLSMASRLNFSTRLFNLIVTNVPGPQFPLYLLGRELEQLVPVAFLPQDHAMAVAIMSYNGKAVFGLLGDYDAMPDIEQFASYLEDALRELQEAAGGTTRARRATARRHATEPV
jgi:WS/DGAT/MGAT family acyltransferase